MSDRHIVEQNLADGSANMWFGIGGPTEAKRTADLAKRVAVRRKWKVISTEIIMTKDASNAPA